MDGGLTACGHDLAHHPSDAEYGDLRRHHHQLGVLPADGPEVRERDRLSAQLAERDLALTHIGLEPFEALP